MKKAYVIAALCALLLPFMAGNALAQIVPGCTRAADETTRLATARALVTIDASNYASVINYWHDDIEYKEPVLTNNGRYEMLDYLTAMYTVAGFGHPPDKVTVIKDELYQTVGDEMTYMAAIEWSGTGLAGYFFQTGMSIIKFAPGQGCPYYHRDYWTEFDTWWNIPQLQPDIRANRNVYIGMFQLTGRCFDEDGDGYKKYEMSLGCPNEGLDCNDFDPALVFNCY